MLYKRFNDTYMLRIDKGEEVIRSLTELCEKENIRLAQVDAIGAANSAAIGVYDLETASYHREDLPFFVEIASLSGSVTEMNGKPYIHLHTTLADQQNKTQSLICRILKCVRRELPLVKCSSTGLTIGCITG